MVDKQRTARQASIRVAKGKTKPLYVDLEISDHDRYKAKADELGMTLRDFVRMALDNATSATADFTPAEWGTLRENVNMPERPPIRFMPGMIAQSERISRIEALSPLAFVRPKQTSWTHTHNYSRNGVITPLSAEKFWMPNVRDGGEREMVRLLYEKLCESASFVLHAGAGFKRIKVTPDMLFGAAGEQEVEENQGVIVEIQR